MGFLQLHYVCMKKQESGELKALFIGRMRQVNVAFNMMNFVFE